MATIKDIANRLGVSSGTVSKGLNGGRDISDSLRRQILDTAVEMGYTTKKKNRPETRSLALFVENMEYHQADQFGYEIVLGFRQSAFRENWNVDVIEISPDFQTQHPYDTYMTEHGYSASYILGMALDDPWMEELETTRFHTVLLDNFITANPNVGYVGTDSEEAMDAAISHLISLGHEKIAFLNGSSNSLISDSRMLAYLQVMRKYHLPVNPNLAIYGYYVADAAQYHMPALLSTGATAILCGNDAIASGVIDFCHKNGYSVPNDISVIGFDDMPFAAHLEPPLTTIRQNRLALGKCGVYMIQAMLDDCTVSRNQLRPQLIVRNSTGIAKPRLVTQRLEDKDSVLYVNPQLYEQQIQRM